MSNTVIGRNDLGLTIETFNNNGVIDPNAGLVATSVAITAITELPGSSNTQQALQALATAVGSGGVSAVDLASTALGKGASMVGVHDTAGIITATTVEGALAELKVIIDALGATYLPIANPTFTGVIRSTTRGTAGDPAFGFENTGGSSGMFFPAAGGGYMALVVDDLEVLKIFTTSVTINDANGKLVINDTSYGRSGNHALIQNPLGCIVEGGLSAWNHALPVSQPVAGAATAGGSYTAAEQSMLQIVYDALRGNGTIS